MLLPADKRLTFARLQVLIECADQGSVAMAAGALGQTQQSVRQNLAELRLAFDDKLLVSSDQQLRPTALCESVLPRIRELVAGWHGLSRIKDTRCVVAFLPQHSMFVAATMRLTDVDQVRVEPVPLGEHDRSASGFEDNVIEPLRVGALDVAIGLEPANKSGVSPEVLYSSNLVAMVPGDDPLDRIELQELVTRGDLLVPPPPTRSRARLEAAIAKYVDRDPGEAVRVRMEAYGTKVLVAFGVEGHGTVVVPSDIAYNFRKQHLLGGPASERFKWIPICVDGDIQPLTHQVYVTTRSRPNPATQAFVASLKDVVDDMKLGVTEEAAA